MPDPVSSSCVPQELICRINGDPPLTEAAASLSPAQTASPCPSTAASVDPGITAASSALAQKFLSKPAAALQVQPWDQIDVHGGTPRLEAHATLSGVHVTGAVDLFDVDAHLGSQNADGSKGENMGVGVTFYGAEVTAEYKGWSLTAGIASSLGGYVSSGEGRDIDGDGIPERCFALSIGPFTLGECDEL